MENVNPVKELLREKYFTETGPPGGIFQEKKFFEFMPLFQVGYSTANSYKTSKNTNILNARSANPSCNIPRRSLDYGGGQWKKCFWEGDSYLHTSKPEFCNEQREILHDTKKSNGILGIHHKLGDHDNLPPIKEKENESLGLKSIESRRWYRRNIKWYNIKILFLMSYLYRMVTVKIQELSHSRSLLSSIA